MTSWVRTAMVAAAFLAPASAAAQNQPTADRSEPAVIEREAEPRERQERETPRVEVVSPDAASAAANTPEVIAAAIRVIGAGRVSTSAFAPAIEPYLGRPLEHADLVRLATDVARVLRNAGFGLATAWVPAQDLANGVLTVEVDEGRIGEIRATGPGARLVEQRLNDVIGGQAVRTAELERQLLLVGDMAGLWVGDARLLRENGRNVLTLSTRYDRSQVRVQIDNWGTSRVGPIRAWTEAAAHGLVRPGDSLRVGAAFTPLDPQEFQFFEGFYRLPVGAGGTTIGAGGYVGRTRSEEVGSDTFEGDSSEITFEVAHPLTRSRARSLWLTGRVEIRDSELQRAGSLIRDDRIVSASAALYGWERIGNGRIRGRLSLIQGLDLFDATDIGDPLASRADASGVFTKMEVWAEYWRSLGGGFSMELSARSQAADGPLLSSEEMGLGGPQFLRAFDYREVSGDEGSAASAELRFDIKDVARPISNVQLYAYADGGIVRDLGFNRDRDGLASAGGGIRFSLRSGIEAGVELGVPLTDGAFDADPDPRFSFTISARF
jgi:hemolysin activation/secretion protein